MQAQTHRREPIRLHAPRDNSLRRDADNHANVVGVVIGGVTIRTHVFVRELIDEFAATLASHNRRASHLDVLVGLTLGLRKDAHPVVTLKVQVLAATFNGGHQDVVTVNRAPHNRKLGMPIRVDRCDRCEVLRVEQVLLFRSQFVGHVPTVTPHLPDASPIARVGDELAREQDRSCDGGQTFTSAGEAEPISGGG